VDHKDLMIMLLLAGIVALFFVVAVYVHSLDTTLGALKEAQFILPPPVLD